MGTPVKNNHFDALEGASNFPRHIVTAGTVALNSRGEVLLVRTFRKGWMLPGGQVEVGENLLTATCREVTEESGCSIRIERLVSVCTNPQPGLERVTFTFVATHLSGTPRGDGIETEAARFVSVTEAVALLGQQDGGMKDRLLDGVRFEGRTTYRHYTTAPYTVLSEIRI